MYDVKSRLKFCYVKYLLDLHLESLTGLPCLLSSQNIITCESVLPGLIH